MAAEKALPPSVADWRSKGHYLSLKGRSVFLREAGEGPPLLLLHAYPTASWGFHRIWSDLTSRYRVLAPDLPGSGLSEKGREQDYGLGGLAGIMTALLRERSMEAPHLLAHGYASSVGQEMMAAGQRFASACFVTAGLFPRVGRLTAMQRLMLSPLGPLLVRHVPQPYRLFARRLSATFGATTRPSKEDLEAIWALLRYNGGQERVPEVLCYLTERRQLAERLVAALLTCPSPLILIASPDDGLTGPKEIAAWRDSLPRAGLALLPKGCGHYPPLECPEALLGTYLSFRAGLPA